MANSTILIVDDDGEDLDKLETSLRPLGSELISIKDPHRVISSVRDRKPDVVVMDALLPGLSGFDLCRQIKSDPELKTTRVIIITGVYLRQQYRQEALHQFRADGFVTKPFRPLELQRLVGRLLGKRTSRSQSGSLRLGRTGLFGFLSRWRGGKPAGEAEALVETEGDESETASRGGGHAPAPTSPELSETAGEAETETKRSRSPGEAGAVDSGKQGSISAGPSEADADPHLESSPHQGEETVEPQTEIDIPDEDSGVREEPLPSTAEVEEILGFHGSSESRSAATQGAGGGDAARLEEEQATRQELEDILESQRTESDVGFGSLSPEPSGARPPSGGEVAESSAEPTAAELPASPPIEDEHVTWKEANEPDLTMPVIALPEALGGPDAPAEAAGTDESADTVVPAESADAAVEEADGQQRPAGSEPVSVPKVEPDELPRPSRPRRVGEVPVFHEADFTAELKRELSKCRRVDKPLTLILIEIDDLNQIMELLGKDFREPVLWHVAQAATASLREVDLVGMLVTPGRIAMTAFASERYGGERIVSRMAKSLAKKPFRVGEALPPIIPLLSFGMATFPQDGVDVAKLLKTAELDLAGSD